MNVDSLRLRKRVAREAASLLYFGVEKEYKQAKLKAAKIVQFKLLPYAFELNVPFWLDLRFPLLFCQVPMQLQDLPEETWT